MSPSAPLAANRARRSERGEMKGAPGLFAPAQLFRLQSRTA